MPKYKVEVDEELAPFMTQFMKNRLDEINILKSALSSNDFSEIKRLAHKIKGTSGSYGFHSISDMAKTLEASAKETEFQKCETQINLIEEFLQNSEIVFIKLD